MFRLRSLSKLKLRFDNPQLLSGGIDKPLCSAIPSLESKELSPWSRNGGIKGQLNGSLSVFTSWTPSTLTLSIFSPAHLSRERSGRSLAGGVLQNLREYHVGEGSIKWRRRREKGLEQRKKVLNPSSPVINQREPLPPNDADKFPPELFGYNRVRDLMQEQEEVKGVVTEINRQIESKDYGRLFAVINLKGKQFKVTTEDIIILQGYWAPNVGERLRLHKVLLVGGGDFTITGRPLIDDDMIRIEGTVIEKTLSNTKLHFRLKKRKNFRRLKFVKEPYTMLRINMIELVKPMEIPLSNHQKEDHTIDASYRSIE